ncbi:hypothetical protein Tco_0845982, partial [Tanacetum coccineum]
AVLTRSSSQPTSTYEVATSLSEFELTKILIDKMEKNKSYVIVDYKKKLYDELVKSYNTDKDFFDSYGEFFSLKRSRDDGDKDRDPSVGSDRGKKIRKSSKDSAHVEEPSHTVKDSGMQQDQEFVIGYNDEQPTDKEVTKADWFKKPKRPPTPDPDWTLRMYTRRIIIQKWVEDIQLGVKSYQKKFKLSKPDTYISNLRNKTAYTSYSDPHGIIYADQNRRKRLMRADELQKFSDGTLNDVRSALHDIAAGIRMEYLPMRKWSNLDKKRDRVILKHSSDTKVFIVKIEILLEKTSNKLLVDDM